MPDEFDVNADSSTASEGYESSEDTQESALDSQTQEGATDLDEIAGSQSGQGGVPYSRFRQVNQGYQEIKRALDSGTHPKIQEAHSAGWNEYDQAITAKLQQNPALYQAVQAELQRQAGQGGNGQPQQRQQFGQEDIDRITEAKVNAIFSQRDKTAAQKSAQRELHQSINAEIDKIGVTEQLTRNMMTVGIAELINAEKGGKYKPIAEYARQVHAAMQKDAAKIAQWTPPMAVGDPSGGQPAVTPEEQAEAIKRTTYAQFGIGNRH